ncbi:MAG: DUF1538 domain-containing protein [Oscillospiraceae bacterium]|jgi:hypothetical protein|nr:DUF1538 domain-containing protein [Oscillospiraceae bacterium]
MRLNAFASKLKENFFAVAPITAIVLILHFTVTPLGTPLLLRFLIGSVLIVLGLSFFLIGVDLGVTPLGSHTGVALAKSNKLMIVIVAGFILGFFISVAEPGLIVLADQVGAVTKNQISSISILIAVSVGLAVMLAAGFVRIFYNFPLYKLLIALYLVIGVMSVFTSPEFLGIAFDSSGATTGVLAVPFILSLSVGISALKRDSKASEKDSFGLVAVASTGAILAVMILNLVTKTSSFSSALPTSESQSFMNLLPDTLFDCLKTLLPLLVILIILQFAVFKISRKAFRRMLVGFIYAYLGLVLFFLGVNGGFMDVGAIIGDGLTALDNKFYIIAVAFVIGMLTILAEPAVYVLTHQIEEVTSGYVKRRAVLISLCIGVGLAVALSVVRTLVPGIMLWHYLLPGYIIAIALTFFAPKLFVGIAFDAGGVATGPMTATFILAFTQGAAERFEGANLLTEGFGMISMVATMPIITLQILGIIFKIRARKKGTGENEV